MYIKPAIWGVTNRHRSPDDNVCLVACLRCSLTAFPGHPIRTPYSDNNSQLAFVIDRRIKSGTARGTDRRTDGEMNGCICRCLTPINF